MKPMSKTAAIREARTYVSIWGKGTSWTICGPHRTSNLSGPSTELHASSWLAARNIRTGWRAEIALALMGKLTEDSLCEVDRLVHGYDYYMQGHDLGRVVGSALAVWQEHRT